MCRDNFSYLLPRTRSFQTRGILQKVPADRHCIFDQFPFVQREANQSLGACKGVLFLAVPDDFRFTGQIQQIAGLEINEQQPRKGVHHQITDGIEVVVAGIIGKGNGSVIFYQHKTRLAATVGYVRPMTGITRAIRIVARNIKIVRPGNNLTGPVIQPHQGLNGSHLADRVDFRQ